ncbi:hypothetical protein DTO271G3_7310 [Paecilomyces variotii]|nr:hypothetical protein DTO271G3_7310 [Paecilomyces variotii]
MSGPSDPNKLKSELLEVARYEEYRRRKFEEDKARKGDKGPPWPPEAWKAAAEAARAGILAPEPRFPILITDFMTPQKVQEIVGLESLPEVKWTTRSALEGEEPHLSHLPNELQYCAVTGFDQRQRIKEASTGENVMVRFEGTDRFAWLSYGGPQKYAKSETIEGEEL